MTVDSSDRARRGTPVAGRGPASAGPLAGEIAAAPQRLAAPRRRAQRQSALLALLLVLGGAAGAVYLGSRVEPGIDVVALARPVQRGQVIAAEDLATVRVSVDGGHARLATPALARRDIAGKAALVDLPRGTLLSPELVSAATPPLDAVTVGMRLPAEALPAARLRAGEWVRIVRTDPSTGKAKDVVVQALVQSMSQDESTASAGNGDVIVHLAVPAVSAAEVAGAASMNGGIRLLGVRP